MGTVRPIGHAMTDIEKVICYSQFPRGGGRPHQAGPPGKSQGQSGGRVRVGVCCGQQSLLWFPGKEQSEQV